MKRAISLILACALCLSITACGATKPATPATSAPGRSSPQLPSGDPIVCKMALTVANTHNYAIAYQRLADLIAERSGGAIKCELYYDGQLGTDREVVEAMQMNIVQSTMVSTNTLSTFAPSLEVFDLPCLYFSKEAAYAVQDSEMAADLLKDMNVSGVNAVDYWEGGYYYLTNNKKELTTLADLSGLKVRSQEATVQKMTWEALDMLPTVMTFSELFTALQQGVIDSQCNISANILSSKVYEVQKYAMEFNAMYMTLCILYSQGFLDSLTAEQRQMVLDTTKEVGLWHRENNAKLVEENVAYMKDHGVTVSPMAAGELEKMREDCQGVYDYATSKHGDLVAQMIALTDGVR